MPRSSSSTVPTPRSNALESTAEDRTERLSDHIANDGAAESTSPRPLISLPRRAGWPRVARCPARTAGPTVDSVVVGTW